MAHFLGTRGRWEEEPNSGLQPELPALGVYREESAFPLGLSTSLLLLLDIST